MAKRGKLVKVEVVITPPRAFTEAGLAKLECGHTVRFSGGVHARCSECVEASLVIGALPDTFDVGKRRFRSKEKLYKVASVQKQPKFGSPGSATLECGHVVCFWGGEKARCSKCGPRGLDPEEKKRRLRESMSNSFHRRRSRMADLPYTFTKQDWVAVLEFFDYACAYCGAEEHSLHREHLIPVAKGGPYTPGNIVPACKLCNSRKHTLSVDEFLGGPPSGKLAEFLEIFKLASNLRI